MQIELTALAERVQALPAKGCRLIEIEVARLVLGRAIGVPKYTISLDAAMTLVPAKSLWSVCDMEDGPYAQVIRAMPNGGWVGGWVGAHAATPALALTAAALLAGSVTP